MIKKYQYKLVAIFSVMATFCISQVAQAQAPEVDMADAMRNNGKIYVVVAVCLTIVLGLFAYVFALDRKISKLEKNK